MTTLSLEDKRWHKMDYASRVSEALGQIKTTGIGETTGNVDFEGIFTLFEFNDGVWVVALPDESVVTLPIGTYLMREDKLGHVDAYCYDEPVVGHTEFEMAEAYFERWTDGEEGV